MVKDLIPFNQINSQYLSQLLKSAFIKIDSVRNGEVINYIIEDSTMSIGHNPIDKTLILSKFIEFEKKISDTLITEVILTLNDYFNTVFFAAADENDGLILLHIINTESGISRGNIIISAKRLFMYYEIATERLQNRYGILVKDIRT